MLSAHQVGGRADGLKMLLLYSGALLEQVVLSTAAWQQQQGRRIRHMLSARPRSYLADFNLSLINLYVFVIFNFSMKASKQALLIEM